MSDEASKLEPRSRLARIRVERRISQGWLASATGLSERTLQRLEAGVVENPPLRYLVNCAIALGVELEELIEDEWKEWMVFDVRGAARPPAPGWWNSRGMIDPEWNHSPYEHQRRREERGDK